MLTQKSVNQDFEVADRAIIYDPETGEIVSSHSLGSVGQPSEAARIRFDSQLAGHLRTLEARIGRRLAVHRSAEAVRLNSLHHSVDLATGQLVERPGHTARTIKVQ
jgi:hypothetical protein